MKVEEAARRLDFRMEWIERLSQISPKDSFAPEHQLAEHLIGPEAALAVGFPRPLATKHEMDQHFVLVEYVILAG